MSTVNSILTALFFATGSIFMASSPEKRSTFPPIMITILVVDVGFAIGAAKWQKTKKNKEPQQPD